MASIQGSFTIITQNQLQRILKSAFFSQGKNPGNETVQRLHDFNMLPERVWRLVAWFPLWKVYSGIVHTQVHVLAPLGLSFTCLVDSELSSSVWLFRYAESALVSESEL